MDKDERAYYAYPMRLPVFPAFCMLFFLGLPLAALADEDFFPRDPNRVVLGLGIYNATDSDSSQRYPLYRAEYRMSQIPVWKMHPWIGVEYAHNEILGQDIDSFWVGGGLETDIDLYDDWLVLTLQTGVGYFDAGEDLPRGWQYLPNDGMEFRHQAELAVRFFGHYRAGLGISHMSNANLTSNNNSINSVSLNLHAPIGAGAE